MFSQIIGDHCQVNKRVGGGEGREVERDGEKLSKSYTVPHEQEMSKDGNWPIAPTAQQSMGQEVRWVE